MLLAQGVQQIITIGVTFLIVMLLIGGAIFLFSYGKLWLQAWFSNVLMNPLDLVFMSLRQVHARTIVARGQSEWLDRRLRAVVERDL